jgi:hypothetical protein
MRVDDSKVFFVNYEKYAKDYNDLIKTLKDSILKPIKVEKIKLGDVEALQISIDLPEMPADQQIPQSKAMLEAFFGPGGKMVFWMAPAGEHNVVTGLADKDLFQKTLESIKEGKTDLTKNANVSKTAALLPPNALAVAYISPRGIIEFYKRMMQITLSQFAPDQAEQIEVFIPKFPETPPIGFAVTTAPHEVQTSMVVPLETIKGIGQYVMKVQARMAMPMNGGEIPDTPDDE